MVPGDDHRALGRAKRWAPAALILGAAALYLFRLGQTGLYDMDEGVYAEISREILVLGNWVTPHLDFIPFVEKPPLLYWLNALAFKALGVSEFSARLATALAAVAGVGLVYGIGRDIWGRRAGLAAGAVLATSFGYFIFGRLMLPDMLFVSLLTAAYWGICRALLDEAPPRFAVLGGYVAMAGAVLAKGIIGIVFPVLSAGAFLVLTRDWRLLRRLELVRGPALLLLLVVPWHVLVEREIPGFLWYYVVNEHILRFFGHRHLVNYATLPVAAYLAMTLVWFCPWSLFLPAALRRLWPRAASGDRAERGTLLILLWAFSVLGFFALSASRLEYYALPALPALALVVGRLWDTEAALASEGRRSTALGATWTVLVAFALCLVPAALLFPRLEHLHFYNLFPSAALPADIASAPPPSTARIYDVPGFAVVVPLLEAAVALVVTGSLASALAWRRWRPGLSLLCLVGAMAAGLFTLEKGFQLFEPQRSVARLAGVLRAEYREGEKIVLEGRYEYHAGIGFYTARHVLVYRGMSGILMYGSRDGAAGSTFVSDEQFASMWRAPGRVYLMSDSGDRLSQLRALEPDTIVLGRTGPNWLYANHAPRE